MNNEELFLALDVLHEEKGLNKEEMIEAVENALAVAYKKHKKSKENIVVKLNKDSKDVMIWAERIVIDSIDELYDDEEIMNINEDEYIELEEAKKIDSVYEIGDVVRLDRELTEFGRMASMAAKQVIVQKIREAEKNNTYNKFAQIENEVVVGNIHKITNDVINVQIDGYSALMLPNGQVESEDYYIGQSLKVYINKVLLTTKDTQIYVSRTHPNFIRRLLELEIPEISSGEVIIKDIAREPGLRSKVSVYSENPNINPVTVCIGEKGRRIAAVLNELGNEKIDLVHYDPDIIDYIVNSLTPAKIYKVALDETEKVVEVTVPSSNFSLAIGKKGQNVRLAAKLTGFKIDIVSIDDYEEEEEVEELGENYDNVDMDIVQELDSINEENEVGDTSESEETSS